MPYEMSEEEEDTIRNLNTPIIDNPKTALIDITIALINIIKRLRLCTVIENNTYLKSLTIDINAHNKTIILKDNTLNNEINITLRAFNIFITIINITIPNIAHELLLKEILEAMRKKQRKEYKMVMGDLEQAEK